MRLNRFDTKAWISHEVGARYVQGVGIEIMLWYWHIQLLFEEKTIGRFPWK